MNQHPHQLTGATISTVTPPLADRNDDSDGEWEYEYDESETQDFYIIADFSGIKIPGFVERAFPKQPTLSTTAGTGAGAGVDAGGGADEDDEPAENGDENNNGDDDDDDSDDDDGDDDDDSGSDSDDDDDNSDDDDDDDDEADDDDDASSTGSAELQPDVLFGDFANVAAGTGADDADGGGEGEEEDEEETKALQIVGLETSNPVISFGGSVFSCEWATTIGTDMLFASAADVSFLNSRAGSGHGGGGGDGNGNGGDVNGDDVNGDGNGDVDMDSSNQTPGDDRRTIVPLRSFAHHDLVGVSATRLLARPAKLTARPDRKSRSAEEGGHTTVAAAVGGGDQARGGGGGNDTSELLPSSSSSSSQPDATTTTTATMPATTAAAPASRKAPAPLRAVAQLDFLNSLREVMVEKGEPGLVKFGGAVGTSARPVGTPAAVASGADDGAAAAAAAATTSTTTMATARMTVATSTTADGPGQTDSDAVMAEASDSKPGSAAEAPP